LGDFADAFRGGFHPDVEGDGDVRADVVAADQAVLALAVDLELFDRDVHELKGLEDWPPQDSVERDPHAAEAHDEAGLAGRNLADAEGDDAEAGEND
jgi:hypothetical protein